MLEKVIEGKVREYAKSLNIECYKFSSPARAAVPDRMFISSTGVIIFIEFKQEGKKATAPQKRELLRLYSRNVPAFLVDNVTTGRKILEALYNDEDMMMVCEMLKDAWQC